MEQEKRVAVLESTLARLLSWIAAADSKTGFIFAMDTTMLGLLAALTPRFNDWTWPLLIPAILAAGLLAASVISISIASFPRTSGPKDSLLFFGAVGLLPLKDFLHRVQVRSVDDYLTDLATQCHRNAQIACKKFAWVKRGARFLYIALIPWIVSVFLLYRRK